MLGAHRFELLGGRVALIGEPLREELLGDLSVSFGSRELIDHLAVVLEAEPVHALKDRVDGLGRRTGPVGVLDAQPEDAAVATGEEPVEQGGARAADMEIAGRRGGEARDDLAGSGHAKLRGRILNLFAVL